nr:hypothetical protein [Salmonid herpesvirus 1]
MYSPFVKKLQTVNLYDGAAVERTTGGGFTLTSHGGCGDLMARSISGNPDDKVQNLMAHLNTLDIDCSMGKMGNIYCIKIVITEAYQSDKGISLAKALGGMKGEVFTVADTGEDKFTVYVMCSEPTRPAKTPRISLASPAQRYSPYAHRPARPDQDRFQFPQSNFGTRRVSVPFQQRPRDDEDVQPLPQVPIHAEPKLPPMQAVAPAPIAAPEPVQGTESVTQSWMSYLLTF